MHNLTCLTSRALRCSLFAVVVALLPTISKAQLLTAIYESQLETWLGQGNLQFTNVFTKVQGNTSANFHAASDGKGATFFLMKISTDNWATSQIVGGYNPQSWSSIGDYNYTSSDTARTAFIFNLTSSTIQRQNLNAQGSWYGQFQTNNWNNYGPTFGGGPDLYTNPDLNSGVAFNYSYGGTTYGQEIVSGTPNYGVASGNPYYGFPVAELEVYTYSTIPEPSTYAAILSAGTLAVAVVRRRKNQVAA